jgi:hypothetical protein
MAKGGDMNLNDNVSEAAETQKPSATPADSEAELESSELDELSGGGIWENHNQNAAESRLTES